MEIEKRKRQREIADHREDHSCDVGSKEKKAMNREKDLEGVGAKAPPSEEEVEEFFAILRRMHEAVKYFNRKGRGGAGDRRWSTALEAEAVAMVCRDEEEEQEEVDNLIEDSKDTVVDNKLGVEKVSGVGRDHLLDLNSSPVEGHGGD